MEKLEYITEEEQKKCQKVADAYTELYEERDILVLNAGIYGFIKLQYYIPSIGFDEAMTFTNSKKLFHNLWEEWLTAQLYSWAKGTPMAEMEYDDIFQCLPKEKQKELLDKRFYFAEKAGIGIILSDFS